MSGMDVLGMIVFILIFGPLLIISAVVVVISLITEIILFLIEKKDGM